MTELLIFLTIVALVAVVLATVRDIHDDGYGRRQGPRSHYDPFEPGIGMRSH